MGSKFDGNLESLIENNEAWADGQEPGFFSELATQQKPKIVWFGCSDSRVPAETIVQLGPGEIFVHRNIANLFLHTDLNSLSVLQYAVEHLGVEYVIVCGHYGCGGVTASLSTGQHGIVDNWLRMIKDIYRNNKHDVDSHYTKKERINRLVELNVVRQVNNIASTPIVQEAWANGRKLEVHGWVYDLETGRLKDLECNSFEGVKALTTARNGSSDA
ncbi:10244_t:CDS:2 [Paraglomus brasilianum]|uniref:Carbonic anhydrase n=1 Tax=Paraglomus brasilianum TaxID=144538 RepID=A0A9N9DA14_9GLOM|nr:10244_t:CDS:2 [Paraglomus brasilianum]